MKFFGNHKADETKGIDVENDALKIEDNTRNNIPTADEKAGLRKHNFFFS